MVKGDRRRFEGSVAYDRETGARVTRLTPRGVPCLRNYFYQRAFTEGRLLLGAAFGGQMDLWLLDGTSPEALRREAVQLTDAPGVGVQGATVSPDGRSVFFSQGRSRYVRLDLPTLEETTVYTVPPGWEAYGTWALDHTGTHVAAIELWSADAVRGLTGWERFAAQYHARPRQRLLDIDLTTGEARVVLDERRFIGHPMFRPGDSSLLGFCHEGPHDLVDSRVWLVRGGDPKPMKVQDPGEACMHEFWVPDGSRLISVGYRAGEGRRFIQSFDPATWRTEVVMDMPPCAHLMSNHDGTLLVGDGAGHLGDVAHPDAHAFEPDSRLYLFDLARRTTRTLGHHDSTWAVHDGNTQASHPHPSFTPDERQVLFASDHDGLALYLIDLDTDNDA